jgi:hypothetical protein
VVHDKAAAQKAQAKLKVAQKSVAKIEKTKASPRPRRKAPTQQLAARKADGDGQKPTKVAQK